MIGLDTSVLVRYLAQDDARQSPLATALLESHLTPERPGHVSSLVLAELHLVLTQLYGLDRQHFADITRNLLMARALHFENLQAAWNALQAHEEGLDFIAALCAEQAEHAGCEYTASFDPDFSRHPKARLLSSPV